MPSLLSAATYFSTAPTTSEALERFFSILRTIHLHDAVEAESRSRITARCHALKEGIMMRAWHPSRVERLLEAGYDIEEM